MNANVYAQKSSFFDELSPYSYRVWLEENGLPENTVKDIAQSKDGYLWVATYEGVARFDGKKFQVYDKKNIKNLKSNIIYDVEIDDDGSVWLGTNGGGITKFFPEGESFVFTKEKDGLPSDIIRSMVRDKNGTIWVATDKGIVSIVKNKVEQVPVLKNFASSFCYVDSKNRLWLAHHEGGLFRFENGKLSTKLALEVKDNIFSIAEDDNGNIWVSNKHGVYIYDNDKLINTLNTKHGLDVEFIRTLYFDKRQKVMWMGAIGNEIYYYKDGIVKKATTNVTELDAAIHTIIADEEGNIWYGVFKNGLRQLVKNKFINLSAERGIKDDMIKVVCVSPEGDIYAGTNNSGVYKVEKNGRISIIDEKAGLTNNNTNSIFFDSQKRLWIGTYHGFLNRIDAGGKIKNIRQEEGMTSDFTSSIIEDKKGRIWAGSYGFGLFLYENDKFKRYISPKGDSTHKNAIIRVMYVDNKENLWLGTNDGLICLRPDGEFMHYTTKEGLSFNLIVSIYQTQGDDGLWIGTRGGGLNYFKNGKFTHCFNTENGLFNDVVYWILEDEYNRFWMSCNKGVYYVKKEDLYKVIAGKAKTITCESFGRESGMKSTQCSGAFSQAGGKLPNGHLVFPTTAGIIIINPNPENYRITPPKILVQKVILGDKEILIQSENQEITITDPTEIIEIHFTAFAYSNPDKVDFRYKLKGFNKEWTKPSKLRVAYFSNLPYGEYEFVVSGSNENGVWKEGKYKVKIIVPQPFWYNVYFWFCVVLSLALIVWLLVRLRINQLNKSKRHLETLVEIQTKQIRKEKAIIENQYAVLEEKSNEIISKNTIIEAQNLHMKDSIRYAKRIQEAVLPTEKNVQNVFEESFIINLPRDIVSGDFYWIHEKNTIIEHKSEKWTWFTLADCTGHGVPGALMTVMGSTMLSQIIEEDIKPEEAEKILYALDAKIHSMLQKNMDMQSRTNDGMDLTIFSYNKELSVAYFSSAKMPFFIIRKNEFIEYKSNKFPIGGSFLYKQGKSFSTEAIQIQSGDMLYLMSDGFQDQFGEVLNKKYTKKRIKELLLSVANLPLEAQKEAINAAIITWKGNFEQTDDILIFGVRF